MSVALNVAVLTVSDTRTFETDKSGDYLEKAVTESKHKMVARTIVKDDIYQMRALVSHWIADRDIQVIVTTGGTGFAARDSTPEALKPLFDKQIDGFGELFRAQSFQKIGTSTIQSRAFAGIANQTLVFCLPGSTGACKDGWELIAPQINSENQPCNFVEHIMEGKA